MLTLKQTRKIQSLTILFITKAVHKDTTSYLASMFYVIKTHRNPL